MESTSSIVKILKIGIHMAIYLKKKNFNDQIIIDGIEKFNAKRE